MIAGFYNPERMTRAMERAYALSFVDRDKRELQPLLKLSVLRSILECFSPHRAKRNAALAVCNARGFARKGIEKAITEGVEIEEKVVARMLLVDNYNRFRSPFSEEDDVLACHEYASKPEYQESFLLAKRESEYWQEQAR